MWDGFTFVWTPSVVQSSVPGAGNLVVIAKSRKVVVRWLRLGLTAIIQLLGNIAKLFFILHFKAFPRKRFTIPAYSPPLWRTKASKKIPKIVWQTNYTDKVTLAAYTNYLFNRLMAPQYEHRLLLDADCQKFIEENFQKDTVECYGKLRIGASRADFWRVLVLLEKGGVYLDVDASIVFPLDYIFDSQQTELFLSDERGEITNHFMVSCPGNAILQEIRFKIEDNIRNDSSDDVWNLTGPGVLESIDGMKDAFVDEKLLCCKQGILTNRTLQYPDAKNLHWQEQQKIENILG